jgi:hypothetical protein
MRTQLKYVDPNRPRSLFSRAYAAFSATRLGRFISANVVWKIDPYLLRGRRGFTTFGPTPTSRSVASQCGRRWSATKLSATGSGRSPTVSSRHTRRTVETRPTRTGRSRLSSSPPRVG